MFQEDLEEGEEEKDREACYEVQEINTIDRGVCYEDEGVQEVNNILVSLPELFKDVGVCQDEDEDLMKIKERLQKGESVTGYCLRNSVLCFRGRKDTKERIVLPKELLTPVFKYYHESVVGGHLGVYKTQNKIREYFAWKGMDREIRTLVRQCHVCKISKASNDRPQGWLASIREKAPMDKLFIDYLGPLPRTKDGNKYLFVVVDAFSRFVWLIPTKQKTAHVSVRALGNIFASFGPLRAE